MIFTFGYQTFIENGRWDFCLLPTITLSNRIADTHGLFIGIMFACWSFDIGWEWAR